MIEFKKAVAQEDLANIHKLASKIWREYYVDILIEEQIEYMVKNFQSVEAIDKQIKQGYEYFKILNSNELVGYFAIAYKDDDKLDKIDKKTKGREMFLSKLYIVKSHRHKGIGKLVVEHLKNTAHLRRISKIWLAVNKNNLDSINAYKKIGFNVYRESCEEIGYGYLLDDYFMELIVPH